jgi:hypothetical protein
MACAGTPTVNASDNKESVVVSNISTALCLSKIPRIPTEADIQQLHLQKPVKRDFENWYVFEIQTH